jgi:RNA polymerase sigma-70 factor (ECF subfamily)
MDERIRAAKAGDRAAAESLLVQLAPRARNLVRYLVRGDADVDDITQDALVAVLRGLGTFRGEGTFEAWTDRVVARVTFAYVDKARRLERLEQSDAAAPDECAADGPEEYVARRRAVAVLDLVPHDQRHVLVLHYVLEMTVPEIAADLAIPAETVRSRLRLGRARLRRLGIEGIVEDTPEGGRDVDPA